MHPDLSDRYTIHCLNEENGKLKAEIERLRAALWQCANVAEELSGALNMVGRTLRLTMKPVTR